MNDDRLVARAVREAARPLEGGREDYDPLLAQLRGKRLVLIGEASHGTHEFYRTRAEITKRLIREQGFSAVAVEADWPDAARVNRYVRGAKGRDAEEALQGFRRFPAWMWRNADVLDFVGWLREHNETSPEQKAGFYGIDLYSLHASIDAVLAYLKKVDPAAAERARKAYACFDQCGGDAERYGYLTAIGLATPCEREAVEQLTELQRRRSEALTQGDGAEDAFFDAEQNARLVKDAEHYYRQMFGGRVLSWNLRDRHMAESLDALVAHLEHKHGQAKIVVWAHNSHLGDARATSMSRAGELNVGQLVRERYGDEAALIGFTTHHGTVTAATDWGEPAERRLVRPALPGSYEALFHAAGCPRFLLQFGEVSDSLREALREPRLERAIGVIYRPETERLSHYFDATLPEQFDAVIHIDQTRAVEPLERTAPWEAGEPPETFPVAV